MTSRLNFFGWPPNIGKDGSIGWTVTQKGETKCEGWKFDVDPDGSFGYLYPDCVTSSFTRDGDENISKGTELWL